MHVVVFDGVYCPLTPILLTSTKWWAPAGASKWQMGFNSALKVLNYKLCCAGIARILQTVLIRAETNIIS
jgi:hypothetical protein